MYTTVPEEEVGDGQAQAQGAGDRNEATAAPRMPALSNAAPPPVPNAAAGPDDDEAESTDNIFLRSRKVRDTYIDTYTNYSRVINVWYGM